MKLLVNLEELVVTNCQSLDLGKGEALSGLTSLRSLEISGVQQLPHGIQSAANSLQYFLLQDCSGLVKLPNWLRSFVHLRSFLIYNCPNLLTLPEGFFLNKSLEELRITGCPHLSRWCATIEGFVLIEHIPHIEIDGRLVIKKLGPGEPEENEASSSAPISEFGAPGSPKDNEASSSAPISEFGADNISYLDIKEQMKLYLCLFPNDYEFERETLVQLWMAAGFLKTGHMEDIGRIYFDNFIEEGHIVFSKYDNFSGECKYTINSEKLVISNDGLYTILKDGNTEGESTAHRHVSVVSSYVNQTTFETLKRFINLRTLLFIRNYGATLKQVPSDMFLALHCMEALDLSGSHITELPSSIGNVTQLRYINLSFTLIERLPETIDRLLELQTLKLKGCNKLHNLPKDMRKLINLRHLCFDILGQLSFMPVGFGALTELRTLSAFIVDGNGGCNIGELKNMNNLSGSCCICGLENVSDSNAKELVLVHKEYLTQIQLRWDGYGATNESNGSLPVSYLEPHSCLEKLEVFCYPNSTLPTWMCIDKFRNLTSITFLKCENSKLNVCLGRLPNLRYLDIINMNRVETIDGDILVPGYVSFPKLEKLAIDGMSSLTAWIGVSMRDFPLLSELSIKHCPKISALPFLEFLGSLEKLEISHCGALKSLSRGNLTEKLKTLVIDSCPLLKTKCSMEGEDWQKIQHVSEIWVDLENMHSPEDGDEDSHSDFSLEDIEDIEEDRPGNQDTEASENGILTNVKKEYADAISLVGIGKENVITVVESSQNSSESPDSPNLELEGLVTTSHVKRAIDKVPQDIIDGTNPSFKEERSPNKDKMKADTLFTSSDSHQDPTKVSSGDKQGVTPNEMESIEKRLIGHCGQTSKVDKGASLSEALKDKGKYRAQKSTSLDKGNNTSLWGLILKHAKTDIPEKVEMQLSDDVDIKGNSENFSQSPEDIQDKEVEIPTTTRHEVYESEAIKLVQEAVNELLTIPEQEDEFQSISSSTISEQTQVETLMDTNATPGDENPPSNEGLPNTYSKMSTVIMCKRFIKALSKMRQLKPLPLQEDSDTNHTETKGSLSLCQTEIGEKKSWEEGMLDHALQQVVGKLAPAQKKRVALLVQAFETVISQAEPTTDQRAKTAFW